MEFEGRFIDIMEVFNVDKYEFNIKVEQIKKLVNKSDYETAMKIADTIDWRRVRNVNILFRDVRGLYPSVM